MLRERLQTLSCRVAGNVATVDVVATPEIDQSTNVQGANVSTEFFSNIPTSRTVQGLYTIAPTVARSGLRDASGRDRDPSVAGSSGPENATFSTVLTRPTLLSAAAVLTFRSSSFRKSRSRPVLLVPIRACRPAVFSTSSPRPVVMSFTATCLHILPKSFVRETKNFPLTGSAPNGYSEIDAGGDIGGPIIKNRLTFFAAFNPQYRTNNFLTQTFRDEVEGKIKTPFYSGKVTWQVNNNNTFNFRPLVISPRKKVSCLAVPDLVPTRTAFSEPETGGHNYSARLNSNIRQNWIGEFSFGLHFQRNNVIPDPQWHNRIGHR